MSGERPVVYWFKMPDVMADLRDLRPRELRCFLEVVRAIQRDTNGGCLSHREVARRVGISPQHACLALKELVVAGLLTRVVRPGSTAIYGLPFTLAGEGQERRSDCTPSGAQPKARRAPAGTQYRTSDSNHQRSPTGDQTLEYKSDQSKKKIELPSLYVENECGRRDPNPVRKEIDRELDRARSRIGAPTMPLPTRIGSPATF